MRKCLQTNNKNTVSIKINNLQFDTHSFFSSLCFDVYHLNERLKHFRSHLRSTILRLEGVAGHKVQPIAYHQRNPTVAIFGCGEKYGGAMQKPIRRAAP